MDKQRTFFDAIEPCDPNVVAVDQPRLRGQNGLILERLRRGPATNDELARISRKYTSRVSDIRKAGYEVTCERKSGGLTVYRLTSGVKR